MQLVLSAAGAVVGGVLGSVVPGVGTAFGAQLGWMIGGIAGAMLFPPKPPNLHDLSVQDSAYGRWIPTVYGTYRVAGNVIWVSPVTVSEEDKKKAPIEAAHMSLAIALCKGPITGVRRIWANHKLIYDVSNPSNFQALSGSSQMVSGFTLYIGDETQMPDATMESYLGVGNVPAHRGLAYLVFNDIDLQPYGNVIPTFEFEVTTGATSSAHGTVTTFDAPYGWGSMFAAMPNLTAQGGTALAFNEYVWTENLAAIATINAYQATLVDSFPSSGPGTWMAYGNSDVDGMFLWDHWLHTDGAIDTFPWSMPGAGPNNVYSHFWRDGTDLFYASAWGSATTLTRISIVGGVGTVAATLVSPVGSGWLILGGTATYLYALSGSNVYRLDRASLAVVQSWAFTGLLNQYLGYVTDDDHVYVLDSFGIKLFRPSQNTWTFLGQTPFGDCSAMRVIDQNFFVFASNGTGVASISLGYTQLLQLASPVTLSSIVADICTRAGLTSSQFDVTQLTDMVVGYAVSSYSSARDALKPLMDAYFFDAVDSGGVLKFVKRGQSPVVTIPWADLGASRDHSGFALDPIHQANEFEMSAPRSLTFTYEGKNNDYQTMSQRAFRSLTRSNQDAVTSLPIVFDDGEAMTRAQALLWALWLALKKFQFTTSLAYLQYEPTDVVTLTDENGYTHLVRLIHCQYDGAGVLQWDAEFEYPAIYPNLGVFNAKGAPPAGFVPQTIDYSGPSVLVVLDVPPLRDQDSSQGLYLAACGYASSWPGIAIEVSRDGTSYSSLTNDALAATIGVTTDALANFGGGNQPDELSTVTVQLFNGSLSSVSYATFLSGVNFAYIGGELVLFRNATLIAANTYRLSGFLRARAGTEWAMSNHAAGDRFVFLDATKLISEPLFISDLGNTMYFEYQLLNIFYTISNPIVTQKVTNGRVKPLSPALFKAGHGSAASLSDISISWIRRARVSAQWLDGTDVPLDESSESYQLQILNGSTVVRTVIVTGPFTAPAVPAYTYTAAQITADGFTTGNTISFSVAQNSDQGVLGYAATTSLVR
ncbi:phage tail protein [Burkholderia pseudomallei]